MDPYVLPVGCIVMTNISLGEKGRAYHVDATVELRKGLSLAEADDVVFSLTDKLLQSSNITDVDLGIVEDDDQINWSPE